MKGEAKKHMSLEDARQDSIVSSRGVNQNPYINQNAQNNAAISATNPLLDTFDSANFIKGALLGAVGAYLLTNENAQKNIFKGFAKTASMFQVGMEEMKERFEDAQAELDAERNI